MLNISYQVVKTGFCITLLIKIVTIYSNGYFDVIEKSFQKSSETFKYMIIIMIVIRKAYHI